MNEDNYEFRFQDPYKKNNLAFKVIPVGDLEVTPHQRKPSKYHIDRLASSISKLGFLVPLVVVSHPTIEERYMIIDGQHRFLAAVQLEIKKLPAIVIPSDLAQRMINLNIEKELNIREKSFVSVSLYREYLSNDPTRLESDTEIMDAIENAYYVTLGMAYEKYEDLSGSAFEPALSHCDFFLSLNLKEAYSVRDKRAGMVVQAYEMVRTISDKSRELGRWHPYINTQIITWANPFKGRKITVDFNELFTPLLDNLRRASKDPAETLDYILREKEEEF